MNTTTLSLRIDKELKQEAEVLFEDLGLNMTTAVTMFLRSAVNSDGLPFPVKRKVPNEITLAALAEREEMISNPVKYKRYNTVDELFQEVLNA